MTHSKIDFLYAYSYNVSCKNMSDCKISDHETIKILTKTEKHLKWERIFLITSLELYNKENFMNMWRISNFVTIEKENTECKIRIVNNEILKCMTKSTSGKVVTVKLMNKLEFLVFD